MRAKPGRSDGSGGGGEGGDGGRLGATPLEWVRLDARILRLGAIYTARCGGVNLGAPRAYPPRQ